MFRKLFALLTGGICVELYNSVEHRIHKSIAYRRNVYRNDFSVEAGLAAHVYWVSRISEVLLLPEGRVQGLHYITAWREG